MSLFGKFRFDLKNAEAELETFKHWLAANLFVGEAAIVDEIRKRPHFLCLLGPTCFIAAPDLIRWELELGGIFRTDLVLGNDARREFALIEFEGAEEHSLFGRRSTSQYRHWSSQIEHGFSQTVDWAYFNSYNLRDAILRDNFGGDIRRSTYLVVCGRNAGILTDTERERFDFRRRSVRVGDAHAQVLTYDEMAAAMTDNLEVWKTAL